MTQIISGHNLSELIRRFPDFEPSCETISHKKVPDTYNIAFAIPTGKKVYLWYTYYKGSDGLFMIDMNKDGRVLKCMKLQHKFNYDVPFSTLLYGVYLQETDAFLVEDIYYYKGTSLKGLTPGEKLHYIKEFLSNDITNDTNNMTISIPVFWSNKNDVDCFKVPESIQSEIPYIVHHIQYRVLSDIMPFVNISVNRRPLIDKKKEKNNIRQTTKRCSYMPDYSKLRDGMRATFVIKADVEADIYRLFACDDDKQLIFYNTACIPNYNTSVYMNGHFRKIKENENIDYIEESEDEEDFQDTNPDKHVNLNKELRFECEYKQKFKRWAPKRLMPNSDGRITHISKLVRNFR